MTRRVPPQYGQVEISISNTRLSRCAQVSGAVGVAGLPEDCGFEGLIEVSCLRRTRRGEEGAIARLNGERELIVLPSTLFLRFFS